MTRWIALAAVIAACAEQGERADGGCPEGETCSDQTPDGLFFVGSALGDQPLGRLEPLPVALGGTQKIKVLTAAGSTSPAFMLPFTAASSGDQLGIAGVAPPEVTVQGLAEGSAYLRILEPGTNLLFDRLQVDVKRVDHSDLKPRAYLNPAADEGFANAPGKWDLFAGGSEACVARLFAADGQRLADEGMNMAVVGAGLAAGTRDSWDTLGLTAVGGGTGQVAVRTSDGMVRDGMVTIVTAIDDVVSVRAQGAATSTSDPARAGIGTVYCFRATKGTDLVAGVSFTFTASTSLTISTATASKNCVSVTAPSPMAGTLTVRAAGVTRDFPLSFVAAKRDAAASVGLSPAEGSPGERAVGSR